MINLLIFVVETNSKSKTDDIYISSFLKHFYEIDNIRYRFVHMAGKGNYERALRDINHLKSMNKSLKSQVIYFIDFDHFSDANKNTASSKLNENIKAFTKKNMFDLVMFNYDIEDVFLKKQVASQDKEKEAKKYITTNNFKKININDFSVKNPYESRHTSNIGVILNKYLKRK